MADRNALTADEIASVVNDLTQARHGPDGGDFEPECPSCTAVVKFMALLADGVPASAGKTGGEE